MKVDPEGLKKAIQDFINKATSQLKADPESLKKAAQEFFGKALQTAKDAGEQGFKAATTKSPPGTVQEPLFNPAGSPRAMRFPYTFTAKIVQFPWVYYFKNNWVYKYYAIAVVLCLPVFKKISNVFNSPANVKKWEEIRHKEREEMEHGHH